MEGASAFHYHLLEGQQKEKDISKPKNIKPEINLLFNLCELTL